MIEISEMAHPTHAFGKDLFNLGWSATAQG